MSLGINFYIAEIDLNCSTHLFLSEVFDHFKGLEFSVVILCQGQYKAISNGYSLITNCIFVSA